MDEWKPRRDDHLVEPMFGGLGAKHEFEPQHAREVEPRASLRPLAWAVAIVALALAARVAMLW